MRSSPGRTFLMFTPYAFNYVNLFLLNWISIHLKRELVVILWLTRSFYSQNRKRLCSRPHRQYEFFETERCCFLWWSHNLLRRLHSLYRKLSKAMTTKHVLVLLFSLSSDLSRVTSRWQILVGSLMLKQIKAFRNLKWDFPNLLNETNWLHSDLPFSSKNFLTQRQTRNLNDQRLHLTSLRPKGRGFADEPNVFRELCWSSITSTEIKIFLSMYLIISISFIQIIIRGFIHILL